MYKINSGYVQCTGCVHNTECTRIEASCTAVLHSYLIYDTNAVQYAHALPGASQANMPIFPPSFMVHINLSDKIKNHTYTDKYIEYVCMRCTNSSSAISKI